MPRTARLRPALLTTVAVAVAMALAGCGGEKPSARADQPPATTPATAAAPTSPDPTSPAPTAPAPTASTAATPATTPATTPTPAATKAASAQVSLTKAQIKRALLKPSDLGSGWVTDTSGLDLLGDDDSDDGGKISPARCEDLSDALDGSDGKPSARGGVSYMLEDESAVLAESVETVKGTSAADIAALNKLFAQCPQMTETDADGNAVTMRITKLSIAHLGDASTGAELTMSSGGITLPSTVAFVAVGDEQISIMGLGVDHATLTKAAKAATKRIAAAG